MLFKVANENKIDKDIKVELKKENQKKQKTQKKK